MYYIYNKSKTVLFNKKGYFMWHKYFFDLRKNNTTIFFWHNWHVSVIILSYIQFNIIILFIFTENCPEHIVKGNNPGCECCKVTCVSEGKEMRMLG